MSDDPYTLQQISKKYSSSSSIKRWEFPSPEVLEAIEKILQMNKTTLLQSFGPTSVQKANVELTNFIDQFIKRLTAYDEEDSEDEGVDEDEANESRLRLPKSLNVQDFDYDFQLKKYNFLKNVLSNELKLVGNLKDAKAEQKKERLLWKRYAREYEVMYAEAYKESQTEQIDESAKEYEKLYNILNQGKLLDININNDTEDFEVLDTEELEVLTEIESHLNKLKAHTDHLTELSTKLDEANDLLDARI